MGGVGTHVLLVVARGVPSTWALLLGIQAAVSFVVLRFGRLVILLVLLVIVLFLWRECTEWIIPSQRFGGFRLCEDSFAGWFRSVILLSP